MSDHPLTDEICDEIRESIYVCDPKNMRAAADWQLEQVLEWLKNCRDYDLLYIKDRASMRRELKKAMRPTTKKVY